MGTTSSDAFDALLCFDANLPRLERCGPGCASKKNTLCVHGFDSRVEVEFCNTKYFGGWSDLRIFLHFLGHVIDSVAKDSAVLGQSVFMILTKDRNFIDDLGKEWKERGGGKYIDLVFAGNFISCGGVVIFIQQIDCPSYGNRRTDDLKCAFHKVNAFLTANLRKSP